MADSNIGGGGTDILVPESELGKIDVVDLNFIVDGEEISGNGDGYYVRTKADVKLGPMRGVSAVA